MPQCTMVCSPKSLVSTYHNLDLRGNRDSKKDKIKGRKTEMKRRKICRLCFPTGRRMKDVASLRGCTALAASSSASSSSSSLVGAPRAPRFFFCEFQFRVSNPLLSPTNLKPLHESNLLLLPASCQFLEVV